MAEDNIAVLYGEEEAEAEEQETDKSGSPEEEQPKLLEFAPVDEMINELKAEFLTNPDVAFPEILVNLRMRVEEMQKLFETEDEKNNKKVDRIIQSKGKTLTTITNEDKED